MPVEGVNGILNVESAALHAPQVGVANTNPQHILSVGSNLYVSGDSSDVLTVDGNVVCEGVKVGLIEIIPSYDLEAVANVGNSTSNTIQFTNPDTGIVATGNVTVGKTLTVTGNLNVLGTTTTIDTDHLRVQDPIIELGKDNAGTGDLGLIMTRPSGSSNVAVIFDEDTDTLKIGYTNGGASDTTITMDSAPLSANVNGNLSVTSNLEVGTANLFVDTTNSRVGVGTSIPTESLDVVGNMNLQQVSNVASIKANSNVVTEFPRSKKLIKYPRVALGTNTSAYSGLGGGSTVSGYTIKASGEYNPEFLASKAFTGTNDTDDLDTWISGSAAYTSLDRLPVANSATLTKFGQQGSWLEIKLPNAIQLHYTHVFSRRTHITERNDTADIWASNTGNDGDWVKLATINFNDAYTDVIPMVADINTLTYYQYFAIQITKLAWGGTYGNIGEWELFGTPEYDPEAHGVDVVVKSVPNVPNTDWLEVYYDGQDYSDVTTNVDNKTGVSASDASISNSGGTISFDSTYKAWTFGGTTSRTDTFTSPISTSINGNAILSASMWFKVDVNNAGALFSISVSAGEGTSYQSFGVRMDTGSTYQLSFYFWDSDTRYSVPGNAITTNLWYHMVVTYDGASRKLYLNGENRPQTSSLGDITQDLDLPSSNLQLQLARRNNTGSEFFGSIANFRLFNRALTQDEIYQLYAYQKEYFGHGDLGMTLKAGRLGIGTSEPRAALDVRGSFQCGNSPLKFFVLSGQFPATGTTQDVTDLPTELVERAHGIVFMQGISVSSNGDRINWMRHGSSSHEVDIMYDASVPKFLLSGFDASVTITSKEWRIFVVTT
jgi:hypothetical protein